MSRNAAMLLIMTGASCMSFVGLVMRLLETEDGMVILFYRSMTLAAMVALVACLRRKQAPLAFLASLDRTDMAMGVMLAVAFSTYVYAMLLTSVASALLLLSLSPFFAAIVGWLWIGERPHQLTWPAMALALVGVILMIGGRRRERLGRDVRLVVAHLLQHARFGLRLHHPFFLPKLLQHRLLTS